MLRRWAFAHADAEHPGTFRRLTQLSDEWAVLAEHRLQYAWIPIDEGSLELLFLEDELTTHGIQVVFEPYRPGESGGYTEVSANPCGC